MIKVLDKAFGILEEVVTASPEPVTLAFLADKLQLNKPTCSRIIKELVEAGYLAQVSRQSGYVAGPRAFALGMHTAYEEELREAAAEPLLNCARELGQSVLLAVLYQGVRYILLHHNFNSKMKINLNQLAYNDAFDTATGLVLLAYASDKEFRQARELQPRSGSHLNVNTERQACDVFERIRREKMFVYAGPEHSFAIISCPVFRDGNFVAALGMSAPHNEFVEDAVCRRMCRMVSDTAAEITRKLSGVNSIG